MKRHKNDLPEWPKEVSSGSVTVKVYRTITAAGYEFFQIAKKDHTGRRKRVSFGTFDDAVAEARRFAQAVAGGQIEASKLPSAAEAVKVLGGDGSRLLEAVKFYATRNPDTLPVKTVAEAVAEMLASKKGHASARYLEDLKSRLERFAEDFQIRMADVTTGDLQKWLEALDLSAQTKLNFKRVLTTFFEFVRVRGFTFENVAAKLIVPKVKGQCR